MIVHAKFRCAPLRLAKTV